MKSTLPTRPKLAMINDTVDVSVVDNAFAVFKKVGIFVENQEALRLFQEAGATIKEGRVFLEENFVWERIIIAPQVIKLYDRLGNLAITLDHRHTYFVPGSAAVYFRNSQGQIVKPSTFEYEKLVKLTDALPHLAAQSTAMIPDDVPVEVADRWRLFLSLQFSTKPIVTGTFIKESWPLMKDMLVAVRGSEEALRQKPLAIFDACPTSPLKWSDLACQTVIDCARADIPVNIIPAPMAGATSPATLYGTLVQHTAEVFSGIIISQLAHPGASVIYGGSPMIFDMKNNTNPPLGAIETMMMHCAYAQIGKRLRLPTHGYMGVSDAKDLDCQTGAEAALGTVLAALSGLNLIAGAGMLGAENCQSLEKLVFDNELCGMALRAINGIQLEDLQKTEQIIADGAATGSFLEHPSTLRDFRHEQHLPAAFIDRANDLGTATLQLKPSLNLKLQATVTHILDNHSSPPLDNNIKKELMALSKKS